MENQALPSANTAGGSVGVASGAAGAPTVYDPNGPRPGGADSTGESVSREAYIASLEAALEPNRFVYRSNTITKLTLALAKAQAAFTAVEKTKTAGKQGEGFSYKYADLADVIRATGPGLTTNELALTQLVTYEQGKQWLETILLHSSGEWIKSHMLLPEARNPKDFGQALTYARRYAQQSMLNVAAEEDLDGQTSPPGNDRQQNQGGGRQSRPKPNQEGGKPDMSHPKGPPGPDQNAAGFVGAAIVTFGPGEKKMLKDLSDLEITTYFDYYARTEEKDLAKAEKDFLPLWKKYTGYLKNLAAKRVKAVINAGKWTEAESLELTEHIAGTKEWGKVTPASAREIAALIETSSYAAFKLETA